MMKTVRILIHIPKPIKTKLEALRAEGTTASGLIRRLLNEFFNRPRRDRRTVSMAVHAEKESAFLDVIEGKASDLSDQVRGMASLCRIIAILGDKDCAGSVTNKAVAESMLFVNGTLDRFRSEIDTIMSDVNRMNHFEIKNAAARNNSSSRSSRKDGE